MRSQSKSLTIFWPKATHGSYANHGVWSSRVPLQWMTKVCYSAIYPKQHDKQRRVLLLPFSCSSSESNYSLRTLAMLTGCDVLTWLNMRFKNALNRGKNIQTSGEWREFKIVFEHTIRRTPSLVNMSLHASRKTVEELRGTTDFNLFHFFKIKTSAHKKKCFSLHSTSNRD